jgi:hypothetical protein
VAKRQLNDATQRIVDLEKENHELKRVPNPDLSASFSNFIERLDALVNAQDYFTNDEPCRDHQQLFNKLESMLTDHKIQTKKHLRHRVESEKTVELLKKIVLIQDKCCTHDQKSDQMLLKSKLRNSVDALEDQLCSQREVMQKLAWVENIQEPRASHDGSRSMISEQNEAENSYKRRNRKQTRQDLSSQVQGEI